MGRALQHSVLGLRVVKMGEGAQAIADDSHWGLGSMGWWMAYDAYRSHGEGCLAGVSLP